MRTVSIFFTLLPFTAAASALSHTKYDFEGYSDPTEFGPPPANTQKWSYWPVSNKKIRQVHHGIGFANISPLFLLHPLPPPTHTLLRT